MGAGLSGMSLRGGDESHFLAFKVEIIKSGMHSYGSSALEAKVGRSQVKATPEVELMASQGFSVRPYFLFTVDSLLNSCS